MTKTAKQVLLSAIISLQGVYLAATVNSNAACCCTGESQVRSAVHVGDASSEKYYILPKYRMTSPVDEVIRKVTPGHDSFVTERYNEGIDALLKKLGAWLRESPTKAREVATLLAPDLRATRLMPNRELASGTSAELQVFHAEFTPDLVIDRVKFLDEFAAFITGYQKILVAEFHIVAIAAEAGENPAVDTVVDYDLVGIGKEAWRVEKNGHWKIEWKQATGGEWQAVRWVAVDQTRSRTPQPVFVDASYAALGRNSSFNHLLRQGVDYWRSVVDGSLGIDVFGNNGVAAGDIDGDGLDDLYVCQPSGLPNRLYRNQGDGTFADVTEAAGVAVLDSSSMALINDVDNDRDQDLVVITWREPLLFVNDGKGKFQFKKDAFHFAQSPRGSFTSGSLADFDRDGYLDLYVCAYTYFLGEGSYRLATPYHDANNGPPNVLFRNDGNGVFTDVTEATGMNQNNNRFSFACAWADYNRDGWPDLYVANDFGRNNLYRNNGLGGGRITFTDVAAEAGVEDIGAGMSATWFDYNNDELLDLYVGNMWSSAGHRVTSQAPFQASAKPDTLSLYRRHAKGNSLFRNRGDGKFDDISFAARAEMGRWAWSSDALDFDCDGWQDIYIANGLISNSSPTDL